VALVLSAARVHGLGREVDLSFRAG
jgi:hypothetical protein